MVIDQTFSMMVEIMIKSMSFYGHTVTQSDFKQTGIKQHASNNTKHVIKPFCTELVVRDDGQIIVNAALSIF